MLELVGKFDFLGDGDAVLGDAGGADALLDDDVAALGAKRHLDRVRERIDAAQHAVTRVRCKFDRSEEHTSELQSLMRISYAVFCLKKQTKQYNQNYSKQSAIKDT